MSRRVLTVDRYKEIERLLAYRLRPMSLSFPSGRSPKFCVVRGRGAARREQSQRARQRRAGRN